MFYLKIFYLCIELFDSKIPQNAENRTVAKSLLLLFEYSVKCLFLKWLYKTVHKLKYNGEYSLTAKDAQEWIKENLRGEYKINDTNEIVQLSKVGADEVTSHSRLDEAHLKSIFAIPDMLNNAIFITEEPNTKNNGKFDSYRYYVVGLNIDDVPYTAKIVIGVKQGKKYYDHRLTKIEKSRLIDNINQPTLGFTTEGNASVPPYAVGKDTKLISILQTNSSKVVDENGEPLVVYRGATFDPLSQEKGVIKQ